MSYLLILFLPNSFCAGGGDVDHDAISTSRIDKAYVIRVLNQPVDVLNTEAARQFRISLLHCLQHLKCPLETLAEVSAADVNQHRRVRQSHVHVLCEGQ